MIFQSYAVIAQQVLKVRIKISYRWLEIRSD
jgi:hypothetical protein